MAQVTKGLVLGSPGPAGSPGICILYGSGSPANSSDANVGGASVGSLYSDYTGGNLWFKTLSGWSQVSIP